MFVNYEGTERIERDFHANSEKAKEFFLKVLFNQKNDMPIDTFDSMNVFMDNFHFMESCFENLLEDHKKLQYQLDLMIRGENLKT